MAQLAASWDGDTWCVQNLEVSGASLSWCPANTDDDSIIGSYSEEQCEEAPDILIWPIESMILRPFSLSLSSEKLLDKDVITQEFEDLTSESSGGWWLSWNATVTTDGVQGMLFALPQSVKHMLASHHYFADAPSVVPDGLLRLQHNCTVMAVADKDEDCLLVFDQDQQGIFVGCYVDTKCIALRRVNFAADCMTDEVVEDIFRTIDAITDGDKQVILSGSVTPEFLKKIEEVGYSTEYIYPLNQVANRQAANMQAATTYKHDRLSNLRHGTWSWHRPIGEQIGGWKWPGILLSILMLLVIGGTTYQSVSLSFQQELLQQRIQSAFHQGLPNETVMIDALAQLRKAAGGSLSGVDSWFLLEQLQAMALASGKFKLLRIGELTLGPEGSFQIQGELSDFSMVSQLQKQLTEHLGMPVEVVDTELSGDQVNFRLRW